MGCLRRLVDGLSLVYLLGIPLYWLLRWSVRDAWWPVALLNSFAIFLFIPLPLVLLLSLLARSGLALRRLLPPLLVALIWFGIPLLPKNNPIPDEPVLRVMTLNILRLNFAPERILAYVEQVQPDIVFLQEIERGSTQQTTLLALNEAYPYQAELADEMRLQHYTAINLTLSRRPFLAAQPVAINAPGMPYLSRQVIEYDGQPIALYNIHLVAPVGSRPLTQWGENYFVRVFLGFDDRQRNQQLEALLAHLQHETLPYIVAGDFNTSDTSMTYTTRLAPHLHDSFRQAGQGLGMTWPVAETFGWAAFLPSFIRMDYIFHSPELMTVAASVGDAVGSDHRPVLADLAMND